MRKRREPILRVSKEEEQSRQGIPNLPLTVGKTYDLSINSNCKGTGKSTITFIGTVTQICDRFIAFRHKEHGYIESFLKTDLVKYTIREV